MTRNKLVVMLLLVAMMLGTVAAVSAQDDSLIIWADETRAPILLALAEDVEAELGVTLVVQQVELGDARDQLLIAGPVGEAADIIIIPHDQLGLLIANGAIVPLELDELAEEFTESSIDTFTLNGEVWGVPYAVNNIALIRNVDLVPEAPQTWQEVAEISRGISSADPEKYGFLMHTNNPYHAFPIFTAFGGYIFGFNEDGTYNTADIGYGTDGAIAAGQWMSEMFAEGLMVPSIGDDEVFSLFQAGKLGMFMSGPWFFQQHPDLDINWSIDMIPGAEGGLTYGRPFSGSEGFVVSAFSEKQLLAEAFLFDFVATDEFMQTIFDDGGRPPTWKGVDTSADPKVEKFVAAGAEAMPMPAIPEMGAVWAPAGNATEVISTGADPEETLLAAVAQIESAIAISSSDARTVGLPGSWQAAVGCAGDWDPGCDVTFMNDLGDGRYTLTVDVPAGDYELKVAINASWDENYGVDGVAGGDNIKMSLAADSTVTFTYDDNSHILTIETE